MGVYAIYGLLAAAAVGLVALVRRGEHRRWALWLAAGLLAVAIVLFFWSVSQPRQLLSDFKKAYYPAGRLLWRDAAHMYRDVGLVFVNLPIVAILFTPFAALSQRAAVWCYTGLGGLAVAASGVGLLVLTRAAGWRKAAIIALVLLNGPLYNSLREGNTTHFVLLVLIAALLYFEQGRARSAGALLAVSALMKPPLVLLVGLLGYRRQWPAVRSWMLTGLAAIGLSVGLFGLAVHHTWWQSCIAPYARYPLGAFNVQSVDGFLVRLLISTDHLMSWFPVTDIGPVFFLAKTALLGLLLMATAFALHRAGSPATTTDTGFEISIALVLALLISPVSWSHYYLLLLIPMALLLGGRVPLPRGRGWPVLFGASLVLVSLPVRLVPAEAPAWVGRLFISHFFLGGVLLLAVLLAARQPGAAHVRR